jgi:hypothetical protein
MTRNGESEVQKRKVYSAPRLKAHGSVEQVTKGLSHGHKLDATFVVGSEVVDLTFT